MPLIEVEGVPVNFPFEPYPCQIDYMRCMIKCLQNGDNGILESPTGTGKTLCLLCSSLAWLETKKAQISSKRWQMAQSHQQDPGAGAVEHYEEYTTKLAQELDSISGKWSGELGAPKIIYASRTHSQLSQAMNELKRTSYNHFKAGVLGSREQLCIHPQVMQEQNNTTKVHLCRAKIQARSCFFYNNVENVRGSIAQGVLDIEDIIAYGQKQKCCPYYLSREMKKDLDIIFMPYNYLLDPKSRKAHGVELQGNIVIFDEAHNVERICEDSTSCDLSSTDIAGAIRDVQELSAKLMDLIGEDEGSGSVNSDLDIVADINLKQVLELKAMLHHIEESLDAIEILKPEEGLTKPGCYIFEIFRTANLNFSTKAHIIELVDKIVSYLTSEGAASFHSKGSSLAKFGDVLKIVFNREPDAAAAISYHEKMISKHFKVHISLEAKKFKPKTVDSWSNSASSKSDRQGRVLSYWCFSPGHAMEELQAQGIKCVILTSGTLSPLSSFTAEMGIEFPIQLENPHVIENHQVMVGIVGRGPDNTVLSSAFDNRFRNDYQSSLGNAVVNFARVVPNGLLIFFPSYPVMLNCLDNWRNGNVWNRIEQYKPIFIEPRKKPDFQTAMLNFYEKVNDPKLNGAIFAAVCRGKVSEGLDFTDANGRAVIITGLPYPPKMDPKVKLKMLYLEENKTKNPKGLGSFEWYKQQATRAVNQAIGRVIRHRQDYGAIMLCDNRFSNSDTKAQLPSWVRPYTNTYSNFGLAIRDLMIFFKTAEKKLPCQQFGKLNKKASNGCEGAHFVPTISRFAAAQKSSASSQVEQHVPSMRPSKQQHDMPFSKIKIQYEGHVEKPKSKGSLLDVLSEDNRNHISQTPSPVDFYSPVASTSKYSQNSDKIKKKKILIKNDSKYHVSQSAVQSAETYIAQVKKTLCQDGYKQFAQMLSQYKKDGDFQAMVSVLASLFTDSPDNFELFRKFYKFVRSAHKTQFDKMCLEITGQGCILFHSSSSVSKKRPFNTSDDELSDKRNKGDKTVCKNIAKNGSETNREDYKEKMQIPSMVCEKDTKKQKEDIVLKDVANNSPTKQPELPKSVEITENSSNIVNKHGIPKAFVLSMGFTCSLCKQDAHVPLKAPCTHVCCLNCWKDHIKEKKACPVCKLPVKRKHLSRICFPCGPNSQI